MNAIKTILLFCFCVVPLVVFAQTSASRAENGALNNVRLIEMPQGYHTTGLVAVKDDVYVGLEADGSHAIDGDIVKIHSDGKIEVIKNFPGIPSGTPNPYNLHHLPILDPAIPAPRLFYSKDRGIIYGCTDIGDGNNYGVIFKIKNGVYSEMAYGSISGAIQCGSMMLAEGNLFFIKKNITNSTINISAIGAKSKQSDAEHAVTGPEACSSECSGESILGVDPSGGVYYKTGDFDVKINYAPPNAANAGKTINLYSAKYQAITANYLLGKLYVVQGAYNSDSATILQISKNGQVNVVAKIKSDPTKLSLFSFKDALYGVTQAGVNNTPELFRVNRGNGEIDRIALRDIVGLNYGATVIGDMAYFIGMGPSLNRDGIFSFDGKVVNRVALLPGEISRTYIKNIYSVRDGVIIGTADSFRYGKSYIFEVPLQMLH